MAGKLLGSMRRAVGPGHEKRCVRIFNQMTPKNPAPAQDLTVLLKAWSEGDRSALEELSPLIYAELRRLARRSMRRERPGHTLETGALLNEAYLRLARPDTPQWANRSHFYGVAAQIMRRVLVDHARSRLQHKRGGGAAPVSLDEALVVSAERSPDFVALDEALDRLAAERERLSKVVELRFFGGLTLEETADVLNISPDTVKRDWKLAKAWLRRELGGMISPDE
jgi:RNA polymerase sigma factor (TIGR02999 family)